MQKDQFLEIEMKNATEEVLQNGLFPFDTFKRKQCAPHHILLLPERLQEKWNSNTIWKSFVTTQVNRKSFNNMLFLEATTECGNLCSTPALQSSIL